MSISNSVALSRGISALVVIGIPTGGNATDYSVIFCIRPVGDVQSVMFSQAGATVFDGELQCSQDEGVTWRTFSAFDLIASPVYITELIAGALFRFSISNITAATTANIFATLR